jgi:hypothetical protein
MKRSRRGRLALASIVLLLAAGGCEETTEVVNPMDPTLEPGLDHALVATVRPVLTSLRILDDLLSTSASGATKAVCPDTGGWCVEGGATCTSVSDFLVLDFYDCVVDSAHLYASLDGKVEVQPGGPMLFLTSVNLTVDGSTAISGEGSLVPAECGLGGNYLTSNGQMNGYVTQCDSDPYPTGDFLGFRFSYYQASGNLDGSNIFPVNVGKNGEHVANCTIDLQTLKSSCDLI